MGGGGEMKRKDSVAILSWPAVFARRTRMFLVVRVVALNSRYGTGFLQSYSSFFMALLLLSTLSSTTAVVRAQGIVPLIAPVNP